MITSKFDDLLTNLGTGRWNILFFITHCFCELVNPSQYLSGVYLAPEVPYTCLPPEDLNVTGISKDSCSYYVNTTTYDGRAANESYPCSEWEFDNSTYTSTLTSEFKLVCGQAHLRATYQSLPMMATIFIGTTTGYLADRYGRKRILVVTLVAHSIVSNSIALSNDMTIILVLRFIQGCVAMNTTYSLVLEVCEVKWRSFVGILVALPWAFGTMAFGGLAYLIRDWRYLQITVSVPLFIRILFLFVIDESPRWLIVKGYHDRALKILEKAARWNKVQLPPEPRLREIFFEIEEEQRVAVKKMSKSNEGIERRHMSDYLPKLIRTPTIRLRTIILSTMLFISELVFTGLTFSGDSYSSDPFLYIVLGGLMEIPAYTVAAPIINWLGRKKPAIFWFFFCGIAVLALAFIPEDISWLIMTLAMLGKLFNAMAFMVLTVYLNELFPTEVRMQGVGVSIAISCVGRAIAPYITNNLRPIVPWLPSVVFGLSSFIASALLFPLPETLGQPMIETVEALEIMSQKKEKYPNEPKEEQKNLTEIATTGL